MLFEIFADSGCDIPVEMMKELNIHPVYFYVSFDGETYKKEKLEDFTRGQEGKMSPGKKGRRGRLTSL